MAFFSKASNILKQIVSRHMNSEVCGSGPSVFQMIRSMSSSRLFVGGLSYSTDDTSLAEAFSKYGEVREARIVLDRETGRPRGFGFVTYNTVDDAAAAIQALDQTELHGRRIGVNYAQERTPRGGSFGGGGGGYGGGGYSPGNYGGNFGQGGGYRSETSGGNNYGDGSQTFDGNSSYAGGNNNFGSENFGQHDTAEGNYGNDGGEYADRRG